MEVPIWSFHLEKKINILRKILETSRLFLRFYFSFYFEDLDIISFLRSVYLFCYEICSFVFSKISLFNLFAILQRKQLEISIF